MVNPRQQELARRLQQMDDLACELQEKRIEEIGEEKFHKSLGLPIRDFLAYFRDKYAVGYASKRYFEDKLTVGKFSKIDLAHFKVSDKLYEEWLERNK